MAGVGMTGVTYGEGGAHLGGIYSREPCIYAPEYPIKRVFVAYKIRVLLVLLGKSPVFWMSLPLHLPSQEHT